MTKGKVELRPAYALDCDECGREVFGNCIRPSLSDEELQEMRDDFGVPPEEDGEFLTTPTEVSCPHCGAEFKATSIAGDDIEDEDGD